MVFAAHRTAERENERCHFDMYIVCSMSCSAVVAPRKATPWLLASFYDIDAQSTSHGARTGPTLAPSCTGSPPACTAVKSARKDPRPEEKKNADVQEKHIVICISHSEDSREFIAKTVGAVLNPF